MCVKGFQCIFLFIQQQKALLSHWLYDTWTTLTWGNCYWLLLDCIQTWSTYKNKRTFLLLYLLIIIINHHHGHYSIICIFVLYHLTMTAHHIFLCICVCIDKICQSCYYGYHFITWHLPFQLWFFSLYKFLIHN